MEGEKQGIQYNTPERNKSIVDENVSISKKENVLGKNDSIRIAFLSGC